MRIATVITASLVCLVYTIYSPAYGQKGAGRQQGISRQAEKPDLVTVSGVVVEVKTGECKASVGRSPRGTHLVLKKSDESLQEIHLGPEQEMAKLVERIEVDQRITVIGFRTDAIMEDALVAKTLKLDEQTVQLRDDTLRPNWALGGGAMPRRGGRGSGMRQGRGQGFGPAMNAGPAGNGRAMMAGWGQARGQGQGQAAVAGMAGGCGQCRRQQAAALNTPAAGPGQGRGFCGGRGACAGLGRGGNSVGLLPGQARGTRGVAAPLSQEELDSLVLMREEEKLAHDVYLTLHKSWQLPPFAHIPQAESRHMEAVGILLQKYGIEDPVTDASVGVFKNEKLQSLYEELVERGEQSVAEAIRVGLFIEELDIADLQKLFKLTEHQDLQNVYSMLVRGSQNHLRAFARQLERRSLTYEPEHLSQEEFDRIIAGENILASGE